jgi:hypothetical protein
VFQVHFIQVSISSHGFFWSNNLKNIINATLINYRNIEKHRRPLRRYSRQEPGHPEMPIARSSTGASYSNLFCVMVTCWFQTGTRSWNWLLTPWGKLMSFNPWEFNTALVTEQCKKNLCRSCSKRWWFLTQQSREGLSWRMLFFIF